MNKPETVKIPYALFMDLCKYHLSDLNDPEIEQRIRAGLRTKMAAAAAREVYTPQRKDK